MEAVQTLPSQAFSYLPPPPRTLGDLRVSQNNYVNASSASAKAMRPLLIVAILIAVGAGIAWGVNKFSADNAATPGATASGPAPTVPAATSLPATANDNAVPAPLLPLTKSEAVNPEPSAAPGSGRGSESVKPVKAKNLVAVKAAPAAKKVVPMPAPPIDEIAPVPPEAAPPAPPPAIVIEEKPVAPAAEPAPQ
jgi:hypothetical protein